MAIIILIFIAIMVWLAFKNANPKPKQTMPHRQNNADKEFEDMYFNGASGKDIDDF